MSPNSYPCPWPPGHPALHAWEVWAELDRKGKAGEEPTDLPLDARGHSSAGSSEIEPMNDFLKSMKHRTLRGDPT